MVTPAPPTFHTDWKFDVVITVTFFDTSDAQAYVDANNFLIGLTNAQTAALFSYSTPTVVTLSSSVVDSSIGSGTNGNYTFTFTLLQGPGSASSSPAVYADVTAATATAALSAIQTASLAMTNKRPFPVKINFLHT